MLHKHESQVTTINVRSLVWGHVPSTPALGRQRQEDHWDLLVANLVPGSVRDPVWGHKMESNITRHLTFSSDL